MAYETANGTTTQNAVDYHKAAKGAAEIRLDAILRRAERVVRSLAPSPSTPPADEYRAAAADAELVAFEYLWQRPDYLERKKLLNAEVTYAKAGSLESAIQAIMGGYYVGEEEPSRVETGGAVVFNVSDEPLF